MSSNDFLEFDDDSQTQEGSSGRSPFVILVVILLIILILASIFTVSLLNGRNQDNGQEAAAIEATNAVIAVTNEAVNQTIAAMEAEASRPPTETATPTPAVTDEPTETPIPSPTNTPTTVPAEAGDDDDDSTETVDATVDGSNETITNTTDVDNGTVTVDSTPDAAFDTSGTDSTLPQTGLDTWAAILLAVFFIGLVIASRRLRSN